MKCEDCECIIEKAKELNAHVKLLGGWAIHYTSKLPESLDPILSRKPNDIDIIGLRKEKNKLYKILKSCGYEPDEKFNAFNGDYRLLFHKNNILLDVFLNEFSMCQDIDLTDRLNDENPTLSVDDLLLTKIQIIEINEKDLKDILKLIASHDINEKGYNFNAINLEFVAKISGDDYGIYRSYLLNLKKAEEYISKIETEERYKKEITEKIERIMSTVLDSKKSLKWKLRAKLGDSVPWYKIPEEKKR